jgi:uncharacterized membrane protein
VGADVGGDRPHHEARLKHEIRRPQASGTRALEPPLNPPVLLILLALGLAIFGTIRFTRSLEPRQRSVAWLVFIVAVIWFFMKLVQMGLLGRATRAEP